MTIEEQSERIANFFKTRRHLSLMEWWTQQDTLNLSLQLTPDTSILENLPFSTLKYARHVLFTCDDYEWVVIKWLPQQSTSIHGHPSGGCLFFVVSGVLTEYRYPTDKDETMLVSPIQLSETSGLHYIDDTLGVHRVENTSEFPAISIHFYSPPFTRNSSVPENT